MYRVLFRIPLHYIGLSDLPVYSYGCMMMLGFMAAILLTKWLAGREGISADTVYNISVCAVVSGIVGARAAWVIRFAEPGITFTQMIAVWDGGLVYYGGLLLALLTCSFYAWRRKLPVARTADCFAPGLALGLAFGRVGCLLNGCCFGAVCQPDRWYGLSFPAGSHAARKHALEGLLAPGSASLPVYAVQPAASLAGIIIAAVILLAFGRRRFPGQMTLLFIQLYAIARFLIEFIRDDTARRMTFAGLRDGQIMALVTFLIASIVMAVAWKRHASSGTARETG